MVGPIGTAARKSIDQLRAHRQPTNFATHINQTNKQVMYIKSTMGPRFQIYF